MATSATSIETYDQQPIKLNNVENETIAACTCNNTKENYNERLTLYKKPIKQDNYKLEAYANDIPQEIRRQQILENQKKNRYNSFNLGRKTFQEIFSSENEEEMEAEAEEEEKLERLEENMEIDVSKKKKYKVREEYTRILMYSEWMLDVPEDFTDKWIMVPCPVGKRTLIVALGGSTSVYSKRGVRLFRFKSALPGGSRKTFRNNFTILDCIWLADQKLFYVLDVLGWSNQEMVNCDTEFRFYWLKMQLQEISELKTQINGINDYPILLLPAVPCDQDFYECLEQVSSSFKIDGLLFYHKETHYTNGRTPLVTWLKTYMLPEVLSTNIPESLEKKPNNYIDFKHHVLKVENEKKRRKSMQRRKDKSKNTEEEAME